MNQLIVQELLAPAVLRECRKNDRYRVTHLIGVTGQGTGKILDIGRDGLSLGCLYFQTFPSVWSMDLIDARGFHLKQLKVRKVWERQSGYPEFPENFELEVGVEFTNLTSRQESDLALIFDNLPFIELKEPHVF